MLRFSKGSAKEEFLPRQKQNDQLKHDAHVAGGAPLPDV